MSVEGDPTARSIWPTAAAVAVVAAVAGFGGGFALGAYPSDSGAYALPRLREVIRNAGEPSKMDKLYSASLAACESMIGRPALEMNKTTIRPVKMRPLSAYLDDYKIVGTDERQFAKVVCRTYLEGAQVSYENTNFGIYSVTKGAYDD